MDREATTPVCYRHTDRATRLSCSECGRPICVECSHDAAVGQKCPECAGRGNRTRVVTARDLSRNRYRQSPVTYGIIGLTVLFFLIQQGSGAVDCPPYRGVNFLSCNLAQVNFFVQDGELWRIVTASLLHGSILHIGFNMYLLYLFGPQIEREAGHIPFLLLYVPGSAAGGAAYFLFGDQFSFAVGASDAVFALFGVWAAATWRMRYTASGRAMFNQVGLLIAINLALPLFISNIAWQAHMGGLVAGLAIGWAWSEFAAGKPNAQVRRSVIATLVGLVAVAAVLML